MWSPNFPTIRDIIHWLKYRHIDHFEVRWRPPEGRGWRRVDDPTSGFDPSDLEKPLSVDLFRKHAFHVNYYQGHYRLVPINEQGQMEKSVWQTWFEEGPSLQMEKQKREQEKQKREAMVEELEEIKQMVASR